MRQAKDFTTDFDPSAQAYTAYTVFPAKSHGVELWEYRYPINSKTENPG